jgi:hypothetical protein
MTKLYLILPVFFLFGCQIEADKENLCSEFDISIEILDNRIDLTLKEINNSIESASERRMYALKHVTDKIVPEFNQIKKLHLANKSFDKEISNIINELNYVGTNLDANSNFLDQTIINQINHCINEITSLSSLKLHECNSIAIQKITSVEEHVIGLIFTIAKSEKYLFNIVVPIPLPVMNEVYKIEQGDSLEVMIGKFAFDSTRQYTVRYWIDDSLKKDQNKMEFSGYEGERISFGGSQGKHKVYGELELLEHGRSVWKNWKFDYIVE